MWISGRLAEHGNSGRNSYDHTGTRCDRGTGHSHGTRTRTRSAAGRLSSPGRLRGAVADHRPHQAAGRVSDHRSVAAADGVAEHPGDRADESSDGSDHRIADTDGSGAPGDLLGDRSEPLSSHGPDHPDRLLERQDRHGQGQLHRRYRPDRRPRHRSRLRRRSTTCAASTPVSRKPARRSTSSTRRGTSIRPSRSTSPPNTRSPTNSKTS